MGDNRCEALVVLMTLIIFATYSQQWHLAAPPKWHYPYIHKSCCTRVSSFETPHSQRDTATFPDRASRRVLKTTRFQLIPAE